MRFGARLALIPISLVCGAPGVANADDLNRAVVGIGAYNVLHDVKNAVTLDLEWRPGVRYVNNLVAPFVGGFITTRGSIYGYVGFGIDLKIGDRFTVFPFSSAGAYGRGDGKDLGYPLEFRSGVEVSYRFDDGSQLGLSGFHLSNAGLGSRNPGVEILMLHYAFPIGNLF